MDNKNTLENAKKESRKRVVSLIQNYCDGSQQRFVEKTGLKKSAVSQYVNGKRTITNLAATKIAATFHVSPAWVMGFEASSDMKIDEFVDIYFNEDLPETKPADMTVTVNNEELVILECYRNMSSGEKDMIKRLLDYDKRLKQVKDNNSK